MPKRTPELTAIRQATLAAEDPRAAFQTLSTREHDDVVNDLKRSRLRHTILGALAVLVVLTMGMPFLPWPVPSVQWLLFIVVCVVGFKAIRTALRCQLSPRRRAPSRNP